MSPPHRTVPSSHPRPIPTTLPDIFLTALSILFLFSSSSSSKTQKVPFHRRFLRIPPMSEPKQRLFATPQCLSDWLKPRLPSDSFASWGVKPGTKNVHNLWLELYEGETSLADSTPPVRTVHVVTVRIIGPDNRILVESHQELSDGSTRARSRPLSEKMKPQETPESAVFRAVREELGSIIRGSSGDLSTKNGVVRIVPGSYCKKVEERNSVSYPGLPARYVLHSLDAVVEGLPEGEFCTEEEEEYDDCGHAGLAAKAVSVRRHYWKWVSPDAVHS